MAQCSPEVSSGRRVLLPSPASTAFSFGASGSQRIIAALQNRTIRLERDLQLMQEQRDVWRKKCQEVGELMLSRCARFKKETGELSKAHDQLMEACSQSLMRLQRTVYSIEGSLARTADCDSAEGLSHLIAQLGKRNAGLEGEREILLAKQKVSDHQSEMLKNEITRHTETIRRMEKEYADSQKLRDAYKKMKAKLELNHEWLELKEKQVQEVMDKHKDDEKTVRRYENECRVKDKQIACLKIDIAQLQEQLAAAQKEVKENLKKATIVSSPSSFSNLPTPLSSGGSSDDSPPDIKVPRLDVPGNPPLPPPLVPKHYVPFSDWLPPPPPPPPPVPPPTPKTEEDNAKLKRHLTQLLGGNLELKKRLEDTNRARDLDRQRLTQLEAAVNDLKQQIDTSDSTNYDIQQRLETYESEYQKACELLRVSEQAMIAIRQENDTLRDRSNALENELRLQARQNDLMSHQMLTEKRAHTETTTDLQKKIDDLQAKISSMELQLAIQSFDRPAMPVHSARRVPIIQHGGANFQSFSGGGGGNGAGGAAWNFNGRDQRNDYFPPNNGGGNWH